MAGEYTFSELLKQFRVRAGMSQQQLAQQLGIHRNTIGAWERGDWLPHDRPLVLELAEKLRLNPQDTNTLLQASVWYLSQEPSETTPPVPEIPHSPPTLPSPHTIPTWNIPYRRNPFFTGRENTLARLHDTFTSAKIAALTQTHAISGLGGIGKTQTAVEYAYRHQDDYKTILWARADSREALVTSYVIIATLLKLPEKDEQDQSRIVEAAKSWLDEQTGWLLILDNADNLALASEFIPAKGKGHTLLTTREQVTGAVAQRIELATMKPEEGALFLLRRAQILAPDAPPDNASGKDRTIAREISQRMGGLPLALDQAGAYIEVTGCSLAEYLERYEKQLAELLRYRGKAALHDHPEPVATTWSLSFKCVQDANPAATDLLRLCAFLHPDAIPLEIITDGAPDLGPLLEPFAINRVGMDLAIAELRRYSLLHRDSDARLLTIHRLIQAVLKDSMDEHTQRLWAERAVRAVNRAFPNADFPTWDRCQRCLPHAQTCAELIDKWNLTFPESVRLLIEAGDYLLGRAQYLAAESLLTRALALTEQTLGSEHPNIVQVLNCLALLRYYQGEYDQAESLYMRSLVICDTTLKPEDFQVANTLNNLAVLYRDQHKYAQAESLFQRVLAICENASEPDPEDVATSLNNLALAYYDQGKYAQAEPLYQRVLAIYKRILPAGHPHFTNSLNNLGLLYYVQGKYAQAESLHQQALAIRKQTFGPEHPEVANSLGNLALVYAVQGKYTQAESFNQQALAIYKQKLGSEHPLVALQLCNQGGFLRVQGRYAEAEQFLNESLAICKKKLEPDNLQMTGALRHLAEVYRAQGNYAQAEHILLRTLAIRERYLALEHPDIAQTCTSLARVYSSQSQHEKAEPLFQRALHIQESKLGPNHPDAATTFHHLALLYIAQGQYTRAEPLLQQALAIRQRTLGPDHPDTDESQKHYTDLLNKRG